MISKLITLKPNMNLISSSTGCKHGDAQELKVLELSFPGMINSRLNHFLIPQSIWPITPLLDSFKEVSWMDQRLDLLELKLRT